MQICLKAARELIKERQRPAPACYNMTWEVAVQTLTAGVVLVTEYRASLLTDGGQLSADLRVEIDRAVALIGSSGAVARQATRLLQSILNQAEANMVVPETAPSPAESGEHARGGGAQLELSEVDDGSEFLRWDDIFGVSWSTTAAFLLLRRTLT